MGECPTPKIHSENGGPFRYCPCGWMETTPARDPVSDATEAVLAFDPTLSRVYARGIASAVIAAMDK